MVQTAAKCEISALALTWECLKMGCIPPFLADFSGRRMHDKLSGWWFGTLFFIFHHIWVVILPID
jgi:hypothetical protein